ncbi:MAG: phospholipase D family protein [Candidatus Delongbacteria bacterium]|nr:phospholipase D family protein [Candidatus Delongbacteria bacterium]
MDIKLINQKLGENTLNEEINNALSEGKYNEFQAIVAYISWGGIKLINEKLEKFYDAGKRVSLIVGVGEDGSEVDVLRYLKQRLPKAINYIFYAPVTYYKFHPKIYIFSNKKSSLFLIGSNNLTLGGLFCNSECCVKLEIDNKNDNELITSMNSLWKSYTNPKPPFHKNNLQKLSDKLLAAFPKVKKRKNHSRNNHLNKLNSIFPKIKMPKVPKTTLKKEISKETITDSSSRKNRDRVLLLEILNETGAGGTQVQIPREVIKKYFNVSTNGHQTIEVKIEDNEIRPAVICHFQNNTHRISFSEIVNLRRPFLMKIIRKRTKLYSVTFLKGRTYRKEILRCNNRTRKSAKRWRVASH